MAPLDEGGALAVAMVPDTSSFSSTSNRGNADVTKKRSLLQSFVQDIAAGGLASVISKTAMAPIERSATVSSLLLVFFL